MLKIRFLLTGLALLFGLIVVLISLISTNQVISFEGTQASNLKFYIGESILPDHVAYPLVAVADRVLLITAPSREKLKLQVAYSMIRMDYAHGLLLKNEPVLASTALTKSQKYINQASLSVLENYSDDEVLKKEIKQQLETNIEQSQAVIEALPNCSRPLAEQLNHNNRALLARF